MMYALILHRVRILLTSKPNLLLQGKLARDTKLQTEVNTQFLVRLARSTPMEYRIPPYTTAVAKSIPKPDVRRIVVHCNVTEIEQDAFRGWKSLAEIVFEPGSRLARIGSHAFADTALETFTAPKSLKEIGMGAFMNCVSLREARLNEGLEKIWGWDSDDGAFQGSGLETVYVPSTLQKLRRETFADCRNLRRVEIADGCKADLKRCVQPMVSVETVAQNVSDADESNSAQIELEDEEALRKKLVEKDAQIEELRQQMQKIIQ